MKITNHTRSTSISKEAKVATSFIDRGLGLLLRSNPRSLIFKTRFGLHTFGLSGPIDILLLDQDNRVIKKAESFAANRLFLYRPVYSLVIELPPGTIRASQTGLNDKIIFE